MMTFIDFSGTNVAGIHINGKITAREFDELIEKCVTKLARYDKARLYAEMEDFDGIEINAFLKELKFRFKHMGKFEKDAFVTDNKWMNVFATVSDLLIPSDQIKAFPFEEKEMAIKWIQQ